MGCFLQTCGITGLPVSEGNPTVLFLLQFRNRNDGSGTSYPQDIWQPILLPVNGTYDDYGSIENHNFDEVRKTFPNRNVPKDKTLEQIIEQIRENRFDLKKDCLGFMVAHTWAYEFLSEKTESFRGEKTLDQAIQDGIDFYHSMRDFETTRHTFSLEGNTALAFNYFENEIQDIKNMFIANMMFNKFEYFQIFEKWFIDAKKGVPVEQHMEAIKTLAKFLIFRHNFLRLRKMFTPACGMGGQETEWEFHKELLKKSLNYTKERIENE